MGIHQTKTMSDDKMISTMTPIQDGLPPINKKVLVWSDLIQDYSMDHIVEIHYQQSSGRHFPIWSRTSKVTHWSYLPRLP